MKKIFTLLSLLLCFAGVAKAEDAPAIKDLKAKNVSETELLWTSTTNAAEWFKEGWIVTGKKSGGRSSFVGQNDKKYTIDPETDETVSGSGINSLGLKGGGDTKVIYMCVTNIEKVEAYVLSTGNNERTARVQITNNANSAQLENTATSAKGESVKLLVEGLDPSLVYLLRFDTSTKNDMGLYAVRFTAPAGDAPALKSTPASLTLNATEAGVAATGTFTIEGQNLTPGTYSLTVPSVEGLSVSPAAFTVASDGSVSQVVTVSYTAEENVSPKTVSITATVDEQPLNVAVTYSATVTTWELQAISTETVWDFSTGVSGGKQFTTNEEKNTEYVYANIPDLTFATSFNATALAFKGEYPFRDNSHKYAQNGTLHFITTVPGTIVVKFSDTGSSASATAVKRYLKVNGENTEYWASRPNNGDDPYDAQLNVTSGEIPVPAGDVTITGSSAITMSYVKFTPSVVSISISDAGYATYYSDKALDFSAATGLTAYVATVSGGAVSFAETASAPANTGLLLKGAKGVYTVPVATSPAAVTSALQGVTTATAKEAGIYVLLNGASGVGFYRTTKTFTVGANTAYLPATAGSRPFIGLDDETSGIRSVVSSSTADSKVFNLNGQRVAQPTKGLYIMGGKKVVKR